MKNIIKIILILLCAFRLNADEILLLKSVEVNGNNPKENDMFGWQVSVGEEYVFLTSPNDSSVKKSSGSVYIYKKNDDSLDFYQTIHLDDSKQFTGFGNRISHFGEYLVVSSIGKVNTKLGEGYIHLFKHKLNKFELFPFKKIGTKMA